MPQLNQISPRERLLPAGRPARRDAPPAAGRPPARRPGMPQLNQISQRERLLTADGLSKAFAGVHALQEVSFDVRGGEVHALLGENGAGKSALVKGISRVLRADSGEMRLRAT